VTTILGECCDRWRTTRHHNPNQGTMKIAPLLAVIVGLLISAAPAHASYTPSYSYAPTYSPSYSLPSYSLPSYAPRLYTPSYGYHRPGSYLVRGYLRRSGTYVSPYLRRYPLRSFLRSHR